MIDTCEELGEAERDMVIVVVGPPPKQATVVRDPVLEGEAEEGSGVTTRGRPESTMAARGLL